MNENVFKKFPVLETERLILRQIKSADTEIYYKMRMDPEIMRYMDTPFPQSIDEVREKIHKEIESFKNKQSIYWVLELKESGEFIGGAGFWRLIKEHYRAEIGYQLFPQYWRNGYSYEALQAIIKFGFEKMELHSIEANTNPENIASIKLLQKIGFQQEAYFKENFYFNGKFLDSAIFSLLITTWHQMK